LSGTGSSRTYTPAANYNGPDSFTFKANDGTVDSNVATVSLTITPVNDAPVASPSSATLAEDTPTSVSLPASDVDGDTLTVTSVGSPAHGTAVIQGGNVRYTPNANYNGGDSFPYTVSDGNGGTDTASVAVTVTPVNDPPVATDSSATVAQDVP